MAIFCFQVCESCSQRANCQKVSQNCKKDFSKMRRQGCLFLLYTTRALIILGFQKHTQKRLTFSSTKEDEVSSSRDETRAGGDDDVEEEEQSTCMGLSRRSWTEPKLMHCRSNPWRILFREDDAGAISFFISSLLHLSLFKAFPFDKGAREDQGDKRAETETGEGEVRDDTMVLYLSVFHPF
jgi:hypothetical protein